MDRFEMMTSNSEQVVNWAVDAEKSTYFYTGLQEIIFFDAGRGIDFTTDPFGRFIGYRNTGGGLARGVEVSVDAGPTSQLDLTASYTYTNSGQRTSPVAGGDFFTHSTLRHPCCLQSVCDFTRARIQRDFIRGHFSQ